MKLDKAFRDKLTADLKPLHGAREARNIVQLLQEHLEEHQSASQALAEQLAGRLRDGEPIQYVIAEAWFYKNPFYVDKGAFIPRPETEELVDWIIRDQKKRSKGLRIIDVGTGSGCVAVSLAKFLPGSKVTGWDVSGAALKVARKNSKRLGVDVKFEKVNFLKKGLNGVAEWDVFVSNPPYVLPEEVELLERSVRDYEPHVALAPKSKDGFIFYRKIAAECRPLVENGGVLYVEIHADYADEIVEIFEDHGYSIETREDLQGLERMLKAWN